VELSTQFEVDLAMAVVEHKRPEFRSVETFMECDKDVNVVPKGFCGSGGMSSLSLLSGCAV
jgi:hypothetical protein